MSSRTWTPQEAASSAVRHAGDAWRAVEVDKHARMFLSHDHAGTGKKKGTKMRKK